MKYKIETKKTLATDNDTYFRVGEDIAFALFNYDTEHLDFYIGNIVEITDKSIVISNVEINELHKDGQLTINLQDIESNSCDYVYYD